MHCHIIFAAENCCMFFILLMNSIRNRNPIEESIASYVYSKRILKDTQELCSLFNVSAISNETEGRINDLCMTLTKKQKDRCRYRRYSLKRHRVWLDKETNVQGASTEPGSRENTNKDSLNGLLLDSNPLTSSFRKSAHYMHFCYFCPESSFKYRTVERENVAYERASMTNEF